MRIVSIMLAAVLFSAPVVADVAPADELAQTFYSWVLSDPAIGSGLPTAKEKEQLAKFFSPALLKLLDAASAMEKQCIDKTPPGDKPHIVEGNMLVGNYEGATEVIVGLPRPQGKTIVVESRLVHIDPRFPKAHRHRVRAWTDRLVISQEGSKWVISNIKFESNGSLSGFLEEYLRNGARWCKG